MTLAGAALRVAILERALVRAHADLAATRGLLHRERDRAAALAATADLLTRANAAHDRATATSTDPALREVTQR